MRRKLKGFTLVELMIVIAVIALLMIVLLPRIGVIKNKAREAGMKENMLMMEGIIQSVIDNYDADAAGVNALELKIASDINAISVENQKLRNPVTGAPTSGNDACVEVTNIANGGAAVYCDTTDDGDDGAGLPTGAATPVWTDPLADSAGMIAYGAYVDTTSSPNKLCVKLIPYGTDNSRKTSMEKVISQ